MKETTLPGLKSVGEDCEGSIGLRVVIDPVESVKFTNEKYCKKVAGRFFRWALNNVPHGVYREFSKMVITHDKRINK